ncbi:hypothetical protein KFL_000290500 [Klebsormidium nitens]|uniref:Amidase domain-containing protein n=1 Tax=Klebsormidium nitens TaxID=105231 RepID=A0A1Y1HLB1_KLENI|nr:hypothetical protein KFL_000290500 [Klebsormidium nitens]|eukprot:GAQ79400.1 hypothetical protein KFL_000290500 [Klebsormidium nitens]
MQGPPAQLAEVARFCQEEGAAGKEKILLHYLKRIAVLNPLLRAVTEVASFQQLRNAGTSQEDHGGPECGPGNVSTARGGSSNQEGSAELFEEGRAESSSKESSLERRSDRPGKSAKLALAINADRELHSVLLFERRKHHNSDWTLPPSQHPKPQSTRPLEGVPFLVKDVIDVAGFRTVAGCELLARTHPADASADIVRQLQALGAVPVGKSTVPEACSQSRVDVQTFSSLHSVTENPYKFSITSGGSSGGSAVAVATGMVPLAVGTDWAGSLRIPPSAASVRSALPVAG